MRILYLHASKYGNGAMVAEEFAQQAGARGATTTVHHVRDVDPRRLPAADLYVLSSPGRMGRPIGRMRRFLRRLRLPAGTRCAVITTEAAPEFDAQTGEAPVSPMQRVRPMMHDMLAAAGLVQVAEGVVHVTEMKGPLEPDWQPKVKEFVEQALVDA